jgi:predicted TPR repeat methyltransferase
MPRWRPRSASYWDEAMIQAWSETSGDLRADRRYRYAEGAAAVGDHHGAADLLRQVIEIVPGWVPAWIALARARMALGEQAGAEAALRQATALNPDDCHGTQLHIALLRNVSPAAMSSAYVRRLFDQYADHFETHLCNRLAYRGPTVLRRAYDAVGPRPSSHAIDLGCGTGLVARAFADLCDIIDGVDLSPEMIRKAGQTGLYRRLEIAEMVEFMRSQAAAGTDLVLAGDTLVYVGELTPVFDAVARLLRRHGRFVFNVQAQPSGTFLLCQELRYAHSADYLTRTATAAQLSLRHCETAALRKERGRDVACFTLVLER